MLDPVLCSALANLYANSGSSKGDFNPILKSFTDSLESGA